MMQMQKKHVQCSKTGSRKRKMKKSFKTFFLLSALTAAAFLFIGCGTNYRTVKEIHTVAEGQTVWEIATIWQSKQDKKMTIGEFVHNIYQVNHLGGKSYIYPGDKLIIPLEVKVDD
ncbi:LysM peptidoglycan-binding domain-containing protein [uncultured Phascolarctobacterium sp.]|uniref:LysM peptidoglycan-binding domain-containing protein n=1 Tax=uncultured Phascolarctobacterium sp. TaxID=512296 RepID=UPI00261D3A80|nr:LysM peptidoglycan-binding domain-containing protein [uncultured Phascolarctobacterium sp.]